MIQSFKGGCGCPFDTQEDRFFVPGAPCRWLHQTSPFHQLVIYVKTPPQKDQQRLVGKVSNIYIYIYIRTYIYIYIYIYMNKAFTLLDSLITKNTRGVTYIQNPWISSCFFWGKNELGKCITIFKALWKLSFEEVRMEAAVWFSRVEMYSHVLFVFVHTRFFKVTSFGPTSDPSRA